MLIKHSNIEFGTKWWFLYRLRRSDLNLDAVKEIGLDVLRHTQSAVFLKRFSSEEELDIEAAVKYGETPVNLPSRQGIIKQ